MIPKRFQLFEFCDQPWFKGIWREAFMDCLNFVHRTYQPYYRLAAPIAKWAQEEPVLDLASGGGEQVGMLLRNNIKMAQGGVNPCRASFFLIATRKPLPGVACKTNSAQKR